MNHQITNIGALTDEHESCSEGVPVLVVDGKAYRPGDSIRLGDAKLSAQRVVESWSWSSRRTTDELKAARAFFA